MEVKKVLIRLRLKEPGIVLSAPEEIEEELKSGGFETQLPTDEKSKCTLLFALDKTDLDAKIENAVNGSDFDAIFWIIIPRAQENLTAQELHSAVRVHDMRPVTQVKVHPKWFAYRYRPTERVR